MANGTSVTPKLFEAAKILLESGAPRSEITKYLKISLSTLKHIIAADSYDEYRSIVSAIRIKAKERAAEKKAGEKNANIPLPEKKEEPPVQVVEHRQTVTVQATWAMTQEMQKTNKLLEFISNKLAFIVDELCGTKGGAENV